MYTLAESFIQHILREHFILQMKRDITKNYTWLTDNKLYNLITITLSLPHLSSSMFADCDPNLYIGYNVCQIYLNLTSTFSSGPLCQARVWDLIHCSTPQNQHPGLVGAQDETSCVHLILYLQES
jgi:hypothetical protein